MLLTAHYLQSSQDIIPPDQPGSAGGSKVGKDGEIRERKGLNERRRRLELSQRTEV